MCVVMGIEGGSLRGDDLKPYLQRTVSRGPDMERIVELKGATLGFQRLSIMGLNEEGMQPFELGGNYAVCNGELYGFRQIRQELIDKYNYEFKSDSDCEILLPMYEIYGCEMFKKLDAEFACIIYDGTGDIVFASEAKNLEGMVGRIMPFPPGHYYRMGHFVRYCDITEVKEYVKDDIETVCRNIHDKLVQGIRKRLDADAPIGFLLSGGLDSSLVCAVSAKILCKPIKTFAIGMSTDAIDLKYAKQVADYIHSDHTEVIITKEDVIKALPDVVKLLATYDITTIRASIGMYLCCKAIHEQTDVRVILTGEISDELFGYKYTDFAPDAAAFQAEAVKRVSELYMYDVLRADRCISVNSLEARVPFGDLDFVRYVMSIDPEMKLNRYNKGKYLLRNAFRGDYLPEEILMREKAAFSDAVGHSMVDHLKEYAEAKYTDEEFEILSAKYDHARPFTKESLLYRELFEEYYPGQSEMIADFWMPNREWEGCDVNDPSARVLSNYGDSGK